MAPTEVAEGEREQLESSIIDAVERDHDRLATRMIAEIADSITEYGFDGSEELWDDVRAHCDANIRQFLVHARAGRVPASSDLEFVREATRRRVLQGVPLDAVLHSFRIGHRVVWDALVERAEDTGQASAILVGFARISMSYVDAVCTCVADTYLTEQQQALADADRSARDLLELILAGDPKAVEAAEAIGIPLDPSGRYLTVVADSGQSEEASPPTELAGRLRRAFPVESRLVVVRQQGIVCVIACETVSEQEVARRIRSELVAGGYDRARARASIGLVRTGPAGIVESHNQAVSALDLCGPQRPVVSIAQITVLDFLVATAGEPASVLIPEKVRELALSTAGSDRAMIETLEAFARAEMNVQRTADELPAHPNTVRYRLSRISERTGIQWRDPEQLVELLVCIRLARRSAAAPAR